MAARNIRLLVWVFLTFTSCVLPVSLLVFGRWMPLSLADTTSGVVVLFIVVSTLALCAWYLSCVFRDPTRTKREKTVSVFLVLVLGAFVASVGVFRRCWVSR